MTPCTDEGTHTLLRRILNLWCEVDNRSHLSQFAMCILSVRPLCAQWDFSPDGDAGLDCRVVRSQAVEHNATPARISRVQSESARGCFLKGLETLKLRMHAHSASALHLTRWLKQQSAVKKVNYPSLE